MTEEQRPSGTPGPATTARVIHAAITAGVVIIFAVFLFLRTRTGADYPSEAAAIMRWVGLGILFVSAIFSYTMRGRIAVPASGSNVDDWWRANQPKAVIAWATAEGGGLAAIAIGWLISNTTLMALGVGVALALLFVSRPGALEGSA
ncbi:MAG TPA: hypothetical protein VLC48_11665 [Gemmatimonadota bacterium]|nr:hypothetical protein [Gemmatimonadota bacterium]